MPLRPSIDDLNTTLIEYSGDWQALIGSSRQWESSTHSTLQPGATATFRFRGYQVWVWGTIPAGAGSNLIDISIDDESPSRVSRKSNGSAVFNEMYFDSPLLRDTFHKIVITNRGTNADGNTEFMLDRFEFETSEEIPLFSPSGSSSTTTSPSQNTTFTDTTSSDNTKVDASSEGSKAPVGAITGAVIGVLVLIILVLGYLLWRRRNKVRNKLTDDEKHALARDNTSHRPVLQPTPFPVEDTRNTTDHETRPNPSHISSSEDSFSAQIQHRSEKSRLYGGVSLSARASPTMAVAQSIDSSPGIHAVPRTMPSTTSLATSTSPLSPNNVSSSMYTASSQPDARVSLHILAESSPGAMDESVDNIPPPSYWQNGDIQSNNETQRR